jgi:spore germination cell wall hydrolase CwlJ-like protein
MSADDLDILARTVHGEARSESFEGALAVAWVVVNRSKMWNKSVRDVCLQPWQFSCWNQQDPNLRTIATCSANNDAGFIRSLCAAAAAMSGAMGDPTHGATDYHTTAQPRSASTWPPSWAKDYHPTVRLGAHQFYKRT